MATAIYIQSSGPTDPTSSPHFILYFSLANRSTPSLGWVWILNGLVIACPSTELLARSVPLAPPSTVGRAHRRAPHPARLLRLQRQRVGSGQGFSFGGITPPRDSSPAFNWDPVSLFPLWDPSIDFLDSQSHSMVRGGAGTAYFFLLSQFFSAVRDKCEPCELGLE